ncbi:MAG: SDR family oxidoreductase [Haloarculaceae archaeon]
MQFEGQTVIVTGGANGIGEQIAHRFASEGAHVAVADVESPAETADELETESIGRETDVTEPDEVAALAERANEAFGSIDVLVNNAAIYAPLVTERDRSFTEIPIDEWREVLDVNTTGVFVCCQEVIPYMTEQGHGSVVNISSAVIYGGITGYPHYVTSKGALPAMTRAIATEVGEDNVRVNAVAPGLVTSEASEQLDAEYLEGITDHQCLPYNGEPEDVVDSVEFLASERASFISGSTLHPDGGLTFR